MKTKQKAVTNMLFI